MVWWACVDSSTKEAIFYFKGKGFSKLLAESLDKPNTSCFLDISGRDATLVNNFWWLHRQGPGVHVSIKVSEHPTWNRSPLFILTPWMMTGKLLLGPSVRLRMNTSVLFTIGSQAQLSTFVWLQMVPLGARPSRQLSVQGCGSYLILHCRERLLRTVSQSPPYSAVGPL